MIHPSSSALGNQDPKFNQKKHNTAVTSRAAYQAINESGQRSREKNVVLDCIGKNQPVTSRMISRITGIERTNICRSLFDLIHDSPQEVKEAFIKPCPETSRRVKWYSLPDWPQASLFAN
jgi:predicted HTH transcriptional regulator